MTSLMVLYPSAGTRFDRDYYREHHSALVHKSWDNAGLLSLEIAYGVEALGGGASPFHLVATLKFESREIFDAAMALPVSATVFADIPNFTDSTPLTMVGE